MIKKSEHRGCCYLNGTMRWPVKGKLLVGLAPGPQGSIILDFVTPPTELEVCVCGGGGGQCD